MSVLFSEFFDACDGIFLNYTWTDEDLDSSKEIALCKNRLYDVYVGVDVFGRNCRGGGGFSTNVVSVIQIQFSQLEAKRATLFQKM